MMKKITSIGLFFILLFLLSGCGTASRGGSSASSTPTLVLLPAVTETLAPLPSPSPTPALAAASPTIVLTQSGGVVVPDGIPSPMLTATIVTPTATLDSSGETVAKTTASPNTSLTGTWDFTFGTMSLTQRGARVEGTYRWYGGVDAGQIQGIVLTDLNQFQGIWISDRNPNSQGGLRWRLASDWASFSGNFESGKTGQWCGIHSGQPLPSGCGFSGVWQLHFGSPPDVTGQATLTQTGQTVQGTFVDSQGHTGQIVNGVITVASLTEARLSGTWRNDQGEQDSFEWRLDLTTGRTFQGRRNPGNSEWCGWRQEGNEPAQCGWK